MVVSSEERNLLIAAKAVEQRIITSEELSRAMSRWTAGNASGLPDAIRDEVGSDSEAAVKLDRLLASLDDVSSLEIADSLDDSFYGKLNDALDSFDSDRLKATITKWRNTGDQPLAAVSENDRFRILSEHARGGLGEVHLARDLQLNRQVALKRIREKWASHTPARVRFQLEAEITGRLEHPGIVPVYALGQRGDGEVYYAMRFIRGESLESAVRTYHDSRDGQDVDLRSPEFRNLLHRFVDVCNTIGYAHSRGIIHRDLKPANIMLGKYGETLVVDWGLAKQVGVDENNAATYDESCILSDVDSGSAPTQFGSALGTPQYMSPEQATGRVDRMGPQTDVFGLGATLYFILTGQAPQKDDGLETILSRVENGTFDPPSSVVRVPTALESVCLKAMNRIPADRYATASELADDVNSAAAGDRVKAHRESPVERVRRWANEHQGMTRALITTLLLAMVGMSAWSTAVVLHRQSMIQQQVDSLLAQADLGERLLSDGIEDLRQDIVLLSKRPQLSTVAQAFAEGTATDADRDHLTAEFEAMLGLHPTYMQVRLIGRDGFEKVRVDRDAVGGLPFRLPEDQLQDKGGKAYFRDTQKLKVGDVYLSEFNINMEQGRHQWDTPTLRAAAPVNATDDGRFLGAVVLNMHVERITSALQPKAGSRSRVLLTDHDGQLLYCSDVPEIGFCFERGLSCPADVVYSELGNFRTSAGRDLQLTSVAPRPTIWMSLPPGDPAENSKFADDLMNTSSLQVRMTRYRNGDTGDDMLVASSDDPLVLMDLLKRYPAVPPRKDAAPDHFPTDSARAKQGAGNAGESRPMAKEMSRSVAARRHALCARKIYFDPHAPERFLCLVLTRSY